MLDAQQIGERLANLRAHAKTRQDDLIVGIVDFLQDILFQEVPPEPEPLPVIEEE